MGNVETKIHIYYDKNSKNIIKKISDGYNTSIYKAPATEIDKVNFTEEEWEKIKNNSKEIDFCLIGDYNTINECAGLFTQYSNDYAFKLDQFRIVEGSECYSLSFRPGICIEPKNKKYFDDAYIETIKGNKCKIVYQDFNYNVADINRCCFSDDQSNCNANLINNYTTNHCNGSMVENCKNDMGNPKCIKWLEQTYERFNNEALELYNKWCSDNFDSSNCDYFCKIARNNNDYRSEFCDSALKQWCKTHPSNSKCLCSNTPNSVIPDVETYLGPKECWLSQCSSEQNSKWLTTDQLNIRKKCAVTNCVINIDKLTLNDNASAEFINDCISGGESSIYINTKEKNIEYKKTVSMGFIPEILISSALLILLHISK